MQHRCQLPARLGRIADTGVHALPTDRAVDVRGVPEQKGAAVAKRPGDTVVNVIRREPVDALDRDAHALDDAWTHILPGDQPVRFGCLLPHRADQSGATGRLEREHGEEIGSVERHMQLAIHDRAACLHIGDVEHMGIGPARECV